MPPKKLATLSIPRLRAAFTIMEILVVVAIILVLAAIALPVYASVRSKANKVEAMNRMRQVTAALIAYCGQNDGDFPQENIPSGTTWENAADPVLGAKVWYNVLPRMAGGKGVGDYRSLPNDFYTKDNMLFLPGAKYPVDKLAQPLFAFAINTKLQRKAEDKETKTKTKATAKLSQIAMPARTVAFLEAGVPKENKAISVQPKYDGESKSGPRSFVERYGDQGILAFLDGHVEPFTAKDLLTETGQISWTAGELPRVIWCRTPEENPN